MLDAAQSLRAATSSVVEHADKTAATPSKAAAATRERAKVVEFAAGKVMTGPKHGSHHDHAGDAATAEAINSRRTVQIRPLRHNFSAIGAVGNEALVVPGPFVVRRCNSKSEATLLSFHTASASRTFFRRARSASETRSRVA